MRAMFGALGLLVVLAIVGVLARKQLTSVAVTPGVSAPAGADGTPAVAAPATPKEQVQQLKQSLDAAAQQPRAMPDEAR